MKIILFSFNIFKVKDIRILTSFTPISTFNSLQCEKNAFSPLKPIVNTFITTIILIFFTPGEKNPNFVQVLIRMPTINDNDMGKISTLVQNFPEQPRVPLINQTLSWPTKKNGDRRLKNIISSISCNPKIESCPENRSQGKLSQENVLAIACELPREV